jgi:hypothetical protein
MLENGFSFIVCLVGMRLFYWQGFWHKSSCAVQSIKLHAKVETVAQFRGVWEETLALVGNKSMTAFSGIISPFAGSAFIPLVQFDNQCEGKNANGHDKKVQYGTRV